jgi:subtilisin family serine protease
VGWYNLTPGDGTGQFANLVSLARANGITWLTAAGNDRDAHWGGRFNDPDGDGFHNFSGNQEVNFFGPGNGNAYAIPPGVLLRIFLRWDDWSAINQDYALHVVAWNGAQWQIVGSSNRPQFGVIGQRPTEDVIGFTTASLRPYGVVIERINSGRAVNFELFAPDVARLDKFVPERSLPNLADAPQAITVGAVGFAAPYPFQDYSAQGPTNGPGGTESGGYMKPDLVAYTSVSTEAYGFQGFGGTSASAPHAAGAAALVKGAKPAYSPQQIRDFLQNRAIDMGPGGMDTMFGHGRLFLGTPPSSLVGLNYHVFLPAGFGG